MPELRQNFFTKEWVIIATERARRPEELATHRSSQPVPAFVESCPFCPGNESQTPLEVMRLPLRDEPWQVRVIPNKFAALSSDLQPTRTPQHLRRRIEGFGYHEVIIDTPDHSRTIAQLTDAQVSSVLNAYKQRYNALSLDHRVSHITIFKNHGVDAGASMQHPHSQLIATPMIPIQVRHRLHEALRHYDDVGECMFCHMVEREVEDQTRIVVKSDRFVAMEVFASPTPFATHIFPLRHMASFGDISEMEIADLARVLRALLAKMYVGLQNPDLNFTIRSGPAEYAGARHFHWYVSVIPRLTRVAGFELGSGMFINTVLPEEAAEFLRKVSVEKVNAAGA
ncbi:MAG TPA: galactose-1-phosphate uridylyltransferase [Candidatus Sulfotelmatobacter sp.]|jgi:UDPglucose--hexose-1-phosphate uridylyltransferase|nr:galactose-1-phosphate uridylyltransferase [Candidatus Sulfotelmatobacter sp.]